jgi:hypothetical protein
MVVLQRFYRKVSLQLNHKALKSKTLSDFAGFLGADQMRGSAVQRKVPEGQRTVIPECCSA